MNSGKSKVDLQALVDFRGHLRERINHVSEQESKTRRAINVVSQSWNDGNFKDFESQFSQDMMRIKILLEDLNHFNNHVLKNFQVELEKYLGIKY